MQTAVETVNSYLKKLTVELEPDELKSIERKVIKDYRKDVTIPGFRKGKAPESIIRKRYGAMIAQDIIDEAIKEYYFRAIQESKLEPVTQGKIVDLQFTEVNDGLTFVVELEVEPEFELKKYKGLKVEKEVIEVTDEMVDNALQRIREQYATVKEVDEAQEGHFLSFDVQELDQGHTPIIGHKYENLYIKLGSGQFDPELEKQLIGIKTGEKRIISKEEAPVADAPNAEPKVYLFEVHAKKIEEKEYPELDDEFVKNLGDDSLETLAQLKEKIRKDLEIDLKNRAEQTFRTRLIDELLKENPFDVPPGMVDNYLDRIIQDYKQQTNNEQVDEEALREQYRVTAIHNLRWLFLKKKIAEVEKIEVSDEEVLNYIDSMKFEEKTKELIRNDSHLMEDFRSELVERKVVDLLKENAEVIEIFPQAVTSDGSAQEVSQEKSEGEKSNHKKSSSKTNKTKDE